MNSENQSLEETNPAPPLLIVMIVAAMAAGMGWGIRGQYGHETGAMIAGVLVGLVYVLMFCPRATSLFAARAVAMCALGVSIGGSMTYGQTVGLMHDSELVGNYEALRWGALGLFIKGGIWISLSATFLAMSLSAVRYRPAEIALLLVSMIFLLFLGVYLLNTPFDPANKELPRFYFSDDWRWEPEKELKPRFEKWGGLLAALIGLYIYAGWLRGDRLVRRMTLWGFLGGGLGFSLGECIQASRAWNPEFFTDGWLAQLDPHINYWNAMETTFGAIFGAVVGLGLWLHRDLICQTDEEQDAVEFSLSGEWLLFVVHASAIVVWNLFAFRYLDMFADLAISMVIIPMVAVVGGRLWPYLVTLPITLLPIAGKTLVELSYSEPEQLPPDFGWGVYLAAPLLIATVAALLLARAANRGQGALPLARWSLFIATWTYFCLNFAFFRLPWPWEEWTSRTPHALVYFVCAVGLTLAALLRGGPKGQPATESD